MQVPLGAPSLAALSAPAEPSRVYAASIPLAGRWETAVWGVCLIAVHRSPCADAIGARSAVWKQIKYLHPRFHNTQSIR